MNELTKKQNKNFMTLSTSATSHDHVLIDSHNRRISIFVYQKKRRKFGGHTAGRWYKTGL